MATEKSQQESVTLLATVIRNESKDAISAEILNELVQTIRTKQKSAPIRWEEISPGTPKRFTWDPAARRFVESSQGAYDSSQEPKFVLLGPSSTLVKKHEKRIPIGKYETAYASAKRISPSNELSYVLAFEAHGQRVLVSGDAGLVDTKQETGDSFFPEILEQLKRLEVVQVAHHGGNNGSFYEALIAAGSTSGKGPVTLLLSHDLKDRLRPTEEFFSFVASLSGGGKASQIAFTSAPDWKKLKGREVTIAPQYPADTRRDVGDVRLSLRNGLWAVDQHAVVRPPESQTNETGKAG
jgi:hypothetical protein